MGGDGTGRGHRDRYKKYNVLIGLTQMDTKSCKIPEIWDIETKYMQSASLSWTTATRRSTYALPALLAAELSVFPSTAR